MAANEFFVLVQPDYSHALEDTELGSSLNFTPDVVAPVSTVTAATNVNPVAITTAAPHGLLTGDLVFIFGLVGNTSPNDQWWTITTTGASTFTVPVAGNGAWISGGTVDPAVTAWAFTEELGVALVERDMLAINSGVVGPCSIISISPTSKKRGSATFTLVVNGQGFTSGGVV